MVTLPPNFPIHPLSERFHKNLREISELHDRKQADYGTDSNPFASIAQALDWGMQPWEFCLMMADVKMRRLKTFKAKGRLSNEGVADSIRDAIVYLNIGLVLYENVYDGRTKTAQNQDPEKSVYPADTWANR